MSKKPKTGGERLPLVFVHMHITVVEPTARDASVALRDALHDVIRQHAEQFGLRIKRKRVSQKAGRHLWTTYEERAKVFMLIE